MVPILELRSVSLSLGGAAILHEVSLQLYPGEFLCLIGPNGAAKSSLIKCIDGIHAGYTGDIYWNGVNARALKQRDVARLVAYVPQGGVDQLTYTVSEFLDMARYPWRSLLDTAGEADRRAVAVAAELAGVDALMRRTLHTLSGGERQRVLIASALAQGSSLMLLDEPTTYLDYRHQQETLALIRRINQEHGVGILAVTHDINFALSAADRALAMQGGRLYWEGSPEGLLDEGRLQQIYGIPFQHFHAEGAGFPYVAPYDGERVRS